jgi:hypothetical protein
VQSTAEGDRVRYEARAGVEYAIAAVGTASNVTVDGAAIVAREPGRILLRVTPPSAAQEWVRGEFTMR